MRKKNILDEFWIDWDQKEWKDKYETMKKVAHRLMEEIPSREDLINLGKKQRILKKREIGVSLLLARKPSKNFIKN